MAANVLGTSDFEAIMDNIAKQIDLIKSAYGDIDTPATAMYGAKLNRDRIVAFADPDDWDIEYDLLPGTIATINAYNVVTEQAAKHQTLIAGLTNHLGATSLAAWMVEEGIRVHPNIKNAYSGLTPNATFCPDVVVLASFELTGAGAGTLTDGSDIDRTLYASAQLELYTESAIGDDGVHVTVTGKNDAGATISLPETEITASASEHTAFAIGTIANRLCQVTDIDVTGGHDNDLFTVRSKVERAIALA
jgi:hypothetical protein